MIAEQSTNAVSMRLVQPRSEELPLSIGQVVANLQLVLAVRRSARNQDHAYWSARAQQAVA